MTLSPCLFHRGYHAEPDEACVAHAMGWFIDHHRLGPGRVLDAYEAEVEAAILNDHIAAHRRRLPSPLLQDPDGERQPQPQRQDDDLPTAA